MTFTWDFNTATLLAIACQVVLIIVFMVRTANTAKSAMTLAKEAMTNANDAHKDIAVLHGLLSLHKETVAREFVDKEALREMKSELLDSINRLSDRIDDVLDAKPRR